jgi:phospholipase/lecithinase/hemolysin
MLNRFKWAAVAIGTAAFLAGCGGSDGSDTTVKAPAKAFKVFGDSIVDSGAFGYKFTIQSSDPANPFLIFPEIVAANFGVKALCPYFTSPTFVTETFATNSTCTNFAVGGSKVNTKTDPTNPAINPFSIPYQLSVASSTFAAADMVLIDGGGNDLSQLVGAYLAINPATGSGVQNFLALLGTVLDQQTIGAILAADPGPTGLAKAAGAYAQTMGGNFAKTIKDNVVAKGVTKIVVVGAPDVTLVPDFVTVLSAVAAQAGPATRDAVQGAARAWTQAFNQGLKAGLTGTPVQFWDFYVEGAQIVANPSQFAFTNVTKTACRQAPGGVSDTTGNPQLFLAPARAACTTAYLSANIPAGETSPDWWKSYAFADYLHLSPALNKLIAQSINLQLVKAGWL